MNNFEWDVIGFESDKSCYAFHIPCKTYGFPDSKKIIKCLKCNESLPEEMETPLAILGVYNHKFYDI